MLTTKLIRTTKYAFLCHSM